MAIDPGSKVVCARCKHSSQMFVSNPPEIWVCVVCELLGPKALVPLFKMNDTERSEALAAYFADSERPSEKFSRSLRARGIKEPWEGGPPWDRSRW